MSAKGCLSLCGPATSWQGVWGVAPPSQQDSWERIKNLSDPPCWRSGKRKWMDAVHACYQSLEIANLPTAGIKGSPQSMEMKLPEIKIARLGDIFLFLLHVFHLGSGEHPQQTLFLDRICAGLTTRLSTFKRIHPSVGLLSPGAACHFSNVFFC